VAEQAASGTVADAAGNTGAQGLDAQTGPSDVHEAHHGRPASGAGMVIVGSLYAAAVHIFDDWY
jgi:hypothetical protein